MLFFKNRDSKNIIGENSNFSGILKAENSVNIKGKFSGQIICDEHVNISQEATVNAQIKAEKLILNGNLNGDVDIEHDFELGKTAQFSGNISASRIIFYETAKINLTKPKLLAHNEEE